MRIEPEGSIEAVFVQSYSSNVLSDRTLKRLTFAREDDEWRIVREATVEPLG